MTEPDSSSPQKSAPHRPGIDITAQPDNVKLGVYARYHGMAYQLLSQRLKDRKSKLPKYTYMQMEYLKDMAMRSYAESQKENPSFESVIFYRDEKLLKQDRLSRIKYDVNHLNNTRSVLKLLQKFDKSLKEPAVVPDAEAVTDPAEQNAESNPVLDIVEAHIGTASAENATDPEGVTLDDPSLVSLDEIAVAEDELPGDDKKADLPRSFHEYNAKNVETCLKGLSLCQRAFIDATARTVQADKILEFRYNHGPVILDALGFAFEKYVHLPEVLHTNIHTNVVDNIYKSVKNDFGFMRAYEPENNEVKLSIHPG